MTTAIAAGFNRYILPKPISFEKWQKIDRIGTLACSVIFSLAAFISFYFSIPCGLIFTCSAIYVSLRAAAIAYRAPPVPDIPQLAPLGQRWETPSTGFPTLDGVDSFRWKLELVRRAEDSIVFSGCYCGGTPFDEFLDAIGQQLAAKSNLTAAGIASPIHITDLNRERIQNLKNHFGNRFNCLIAPEMIPYVSPSTNNLSLSTNHTKALVVDRKYFLIGGSGIVDNWTRQTGAGEPCTVESQGLIYDAVASQAFRDMDFVFYAPEKNSPAARLHFEMMNLINCYRHPQPPITDRPASDRPISPPFFTGGANDLKMILYATGPDQPNNPFHREIIEKIRSAQTRIVINHLYVHFDPDMMEALKEALDRGIDLTVITNKNDRNSPKYHSFFTELSRFSWKKLSGGTSRPNLHIHEYDRPQTTLHKKLILIDSKITILGSANIGSKSMEWHHDRELGAIVESPTFAAMIEPIVEQDKSLSRLVDPHKVAQFSLKTEVFGRLQRLMQPFL